MSEKNVEVGRAVVDKLLRENEHRSHEITAGITGERFHTRDAQRLVLLLTGNQASPALQVAAMGHDVQRFTVPGAGLGFQAKRKGPEYENYKKAHAAKSAEIMTTELRSNGLSEDFVERVSFLITHHDDTQEEVEAIGDAELDVLVAADSLSFLNSFAPNYVSGKEAQGAAGLPDKLDFMLRKLPARFFHYLPKIELVDAGVLPYLKERAKIIAKERGIPDPFEQIPNG